MSRATISGNDIYYESYGAGEPIVFVGGLGSSCDSWQYQLEYFGKDHHVVLVDLPGLGRSGAIDRQPSISFYADSVAALIAALGLPNVNFVGVSIGGAVGFELAIRHPDLLKSLTVINMDTRVPRWLYWKYQAGLHLMGTRRFAKLLSKIYLTGQNQDAVAGWIDSYSKNSRSALSSGMMTLKQWNIEAELGKIRCPVLVISTEDGTSVRARKEHLQAVKKLTFTIVPDARHFVHLDKPAEVNRIISDFLAQPK